MAWDDWTANDQPPALNFTRMNAMMRRAPVDRYVDVRDYGAVPDYVISTGAGTDNTAAIQAAINDSQGRVVLITGGRYKTTAPLVMSQGVEISGNPRELYIVGVGSAGSPAYGTIDFHGGPNDSCIVADYTATANSTSVVRNLGIIDRRTSPTGGDGIRFIHVFNSTIVKKVFVYGFETGSGININATQTGHTTDCINIDDVWVLDNQYGITVGSTDNQVIIRDVKGDNAGGVVQAVVRVLGSVRSVVHISEVKHENNFPTPTILINGIGRGIQIDSVISRNGNGGPLIKVTDTDGGGITARNLMREQSGTMIELPTYSIGSRTRLSEWTGGNTADTKFWNLAGIGSNASSTADLSRLFVTGQLHAAPVGAVTDEGKLSVAPDTAAQKALTVRGVTGQSVDIMRVYDATGSCLVVNSAGNAQIARDLTVNGAATLAGAISESKRTAVADANYTCTATDYTIAVTALTATRTITLPAVSAGRRIVILDESGQAGTFPITVARGGAPNQLIDGQTSAAISQGYGALRLWSNGTNWYSSRQPTAAGAGFTVEEAQDAIFPNLLLGAGLTGGYDDGAGTFSIAAQAGSPLVESSLGSWMFPGAQGFKMWNAPAVLASGTTGGLTAGFPFIFRLIAPVDLTVTNLHLYVGTAGAGVTNAYLGLYNAAGTLLSTSADVSTAMQTAGLLTAPLAAPQALTAGQAVYAAVLVGAATTGPAFARLNSISSLYVVANQAAAAANAGRITTGSQTALPASFTPSGTNITVPGTQWVAGS